MAEQRKGGDPSGTEGGTDVEPLRGGMREIDAGKQGPPAERPPYAGQENERETTARKDPPAPYHDVRVSEGGLTPQASPGEGTTPPRPRGEIEATAGQGVAQERGDLENESGNAPRRDPAQRGNEP